MIRTGLRALVAALALSLAACASIPYAKQDELPPPVRVADGSPERAALNARVYDAAVGYAERLFYKPDFGGVAFPEAAASRRADAVAQSDEDGFYAHLTELLELLDDDHTHTLSPVEREMVRAREQGEARAGFGIVVTPRGDDRYVALVRPGTPAAEAGVLPGWKIETIGGRSALLAAPPVVGRTDRVVFLDEEGVQHAMDLTAVLTPPIPRFETRTLEDGVAYIRFDDFDRARYDDFKSEMERLAENPPPGLILDLRTNGGGLLNIEGAMTSWFFENPQDYVVLKGRFIDRRLRVTASEGAYTGPLVILTGPGSASAAELLAGVLQEKGRATIVGGTTRGAVTGTRAINLPDGGLLRVGMLVMTTPGGRNLEKVGVTPDIVVADDWRAVREGRDPALDAALLAVRASAGDRPDLP
ncbi:S41 family peptidase [Brevundimonas sp.]|uniref:S41 family peptidase n=1 Tax=Brevundimonas sp. TaxID=1871086 RepID=UPI003F705DA2